RSTMFGVGTFIINFSGPASPQRHDPTRAVDHALTCTPFPEEPLKPGAPVQVTMSDAFWGVGL
ncbi:hypothetical protein WHI96_27010, partial [Pseudonocardia tropica]